MNILLFAVSMKSLLRMFQWTLWNAVFGLFLNSLYCLIFICSFYFTSILYFLFLILCIFMLLRAYSINQCVWYAVDDATIWKLETADGDIGYMIVFSRLVPSPDQRWDREPSGFYWLNWVCSLPHVNGSGTLGIVLWELEWDGRYRSAGGSGAVAPSSLWINVNKKLSYRRETARQLRIHAQLTRCFSAVAV